MNSIFYILAAVLLTVCYGAEEHSHHPHIDGDEKHDHHTHIGEKFGGDMDVSPEQHKAMTKNTTSRNFASWARRWPNGVIPYRFDNSFPQNYRNWVNQAANHIRDATGGCIKFAPWNGQGTDYVNMVSGNDGCWSKIGYVGGGWQTLSLQNAYICNWYGVVIHEMMHAAGMAHEHQRGDRDQFITVNWNNVDPNQRGNFDIINGNTYGLQFDYNSIMLYGSYLFARDNRYPSTTAKNGGMLTDLSQKNSLSALDVQKIKKFYGCR